MSKSLEEIRLETEERINRAESTESLDEIRVSVLGKKGSLTEIMKTMKNLPPEERPKFGQQMNLVRAHIEEKMGNRLKDIQAKVLAEKMKRETLDVTMPGRKMIRGHKHTTG